MTFYKDVVEFLIDKVVNALYLLENPNGKAQSSGNCLAVASSEIKQNKSDGTVIITL